MGTLPEVEEPEARPYLDPRLEDAMRVIVAGHERGSVRRILLYVACALGIFLTATPAIWIGGLVAFASLFILAMTDDLR